MKKKAAIITASDPFFYKGGIETYTLHLMRLLEKYNLTLKIHKIDSPNRKHTLHNRYLEDLYETGRRLLSSEENYVMVIANSFYGFSLFPPSTERTFNIFHLSHMGFAESIRDSVPAPQYLEWKYLWGEFAENLSLFQRKSIAVSRSVKEELEYYYSATGIKVIHNALDLETFRPIPKPEARARLNLPQNTITGMYAGRWDLLKGSDIAEKVISLTPDINWLIVTGTDSGEFPFVQQENTFVFREVPNTDMHIFYNAADFLIFPSRYEGFGYVFLEALACGLPVISTSVGIVKEFSGLHPLKDYIIPHPRNGTDSVATACLRLIRKVINDNGYKNFLHHDCRELLEKNFSIQQWETAMADFLGLENA